METMEPPTQSAFAENTNTKFQIQLDETADLDVELVDVSEVKVMPQQEQFCIVFRGALDKFLGQGIRTLKHSQLGEFELFLVPIRQDAEGFYYEAVFNRIRQPAD